MALATAGAIFDRPSIAHQDEALVSEDLLAKFVQVLGVIGVGIAHEDVYLPLNALFESAPGVVFP
jgi:hypothetical protein